MSDKVSFGNVTHQSLRAWRDDFWRLTVLATALEAPIVIAELLWHVDARLNFDTDIGFLPSVFSAPLVIYSLLSHHFLSGLIEKFVGAERHGHRQPTILQVVKDLPWLRLVVADLLLALVTALGFVLLVIPGILAATYFAVVLPLITLERQPVIPTFRRSASLVRGNAGRVFLIWIVTTSIAELGASVVSGFVHGSQTVEVVAHGVTSAVLLPIAALPLVVLAFELVDRDRRHQQAPQ